jgi:hypothetical protein
LKKLIFLLAVALSLPVYARDAKQVYAFRKTHECPATNKIQTTCPGWVVNHIEPLSWGGKDAPENMEWEQKAPSYKRDVIERKYAPLIQKLKEQQQ